jgi:hypothetical protein
MTNDLPDGVRLGRRTSPLQTILIILIWLGAAGFLAWVLSTSDDDPERLMPLIVGTMAGAFVLTIVIALLPWGGKQMMIVDKVGMRGEFQIRRAYPLLATYICLLFGGISVGGMLSEPPESPVVWGWALTAISFLLIYALILFGLRNLVVAFRIEPDGSVSIKRRGARWQPLRLSDYREAIGRTVTGDTITYASRVDFLAAQGNARPIRIPLQTLRSRLYRTIVPSNVTTAYFQDYVGARGWRVESKRAGGWKATPPQ